jgi:hypothetical protein
MPVAAVSMGEAEGELGVADGSLGHQMPAVKTQFAMVVHDDDGATRYLAARAAGGGYGNQRSNSLRNTRRAAFNRRVVRERAFMRSRNCHAFGAVNGTATAHSDQSIAVLGFVDFSRSAHCRFSGVGRSLVKYCMGQATQCIYGFLQDSCSLDAGVGHDQRLADTHTLAFLAQHLHGAKVKLDLCHVIDEGHVLFAQ